MKGRTNDADLSELADGVPDRFCGLAVEPRRAHSAYKLACIPQLNWPITINKQPQSTHTNNINQSSRNGKSSPEPGTNRDQDGTPHLIGGWPEVRPGQEG